MNITLYNQIETLDEFNDFISAEENQDQLRDELYERFNTYRHYANAVEWNELVKICELLAIIGWGDKERVDAKSRFNGDCWETRLNNNENEPRFRCAGWKKRKKGWILFNPAYHYSPDFPKEQSLDWTHFSEIEFEVIDVEALKTQRNYKKLNPFIMGMVVGDNETSNIVQRFVSELTKEFEQLLTPERYNEHLEFMYLNIKCPFLDVDVETESKSGRLNPKQRSYHCEASFSLDYSKLNEEKQKEIFSDFIIKSITEAGEKLKKKKLGDNQVLLDDTIAILESWKQS